MRFICFLESGVRDLGSFARLPVTDNCPPPDPRPLGRAQRAPIMPRVKRSLPLVLFVLLSACSLARRPAEPVHVVIVGTTDVHGFVHGLD